MTPRCARGLSDGRQLAGAAGRWFFDDDMFAVLDGLAGKRCQRVIGCGNDDEIDLGAGGERRADQARPHSPDAAMRGARRDPTPSRPRATRR